MPHNTAKLCQALGYEFKLPALCREALTHRSFGLPNNERLEFLGDAILDFVVAFLLYQTFPHLKEGELSRLRANLVQQSTLAQIAQTLDLNQFLFLGEGERKNNPLPDSILADAMEALFGAIFVDSGFDAAQKVVAHFYQNKISAINLKQSQKDCKSRLQEFLQSQKNKTLPLYALVKEKGLEHNKTFLVRCSAGKITAEAKGHSRKEAEQKAAQLCLAKLQGKKV